MMRTPKLGQHFLTQTHVAQHIVAAAQVTRDETVLEIGPGKGVLTEILLSHAKHVVAIEKDGKLVALLQKKFASSIATGTLTLIHDDVRTFSPEEAGLSARRYKLIANIPYYITGSILRTFLGNENYPNTMVVLIQKEVAERIVARSGKHSLLSLSVHAYGTPHYVQTVKAGNFSPPPKVDSAILAIHNISHDRFNSHEDMERFFTIIRTAFSNKRKMVGNTLAAVVNADTLERCAIAPTSRPEDVTLPQWECVSRVPTTR